MKRIVLIILTVICCWEAQGQEVGDSLSLPPVEFSLPPLTMRGTIAHYPYYHGVMMGFHDWELHPGLNASLSAAAIFGFGSNAGAGFANSMALAYAGNITPKLSYSIGGYTSFLDYASHVMKDAGLTAMLNYRFNEHWEAALFAQKSILQPRFHLISIGWVMWATRSAQQSVTTSIPRSVSASAFGEALHLINTIIGKT